MNSGPRKDASRVTPQSGASEPLDNDLLTSQDLFGDLVDGPALPSVPVSASRRGPIKVQVFDPASDTARANAPRPLDAESADFLLSALGGKDEPSPDGPADPTESLVLEPEPKRAAAGRDPGEAALMDTLLDSLMPQAESPVCAPAPSAAPARPERMPEPERMHVRAHDSATPLTGHAQEFESLLDNLGPDPDAPPALEAHGGAGFTPAEPWGGGGGARRSTPPLDEAHGGAGFTPAEPWGGAGGAPLDEPRPPAHASGPAPRKRAPDDLLDELMRGAALKPRAKRPEHDGSGAGELRPAPRTATKFRAASAKPAAEQGALLDLALVAETALGNGPRTAPVIKTEPIASPRPKQRRPPERGAFGPYLLLERLAVGGMAEVFRAKRTGVEGFEKILAVKRILSHLSDNQEFVDMFIHEAKMVAGLAHPNIVQIFDLGRLESSYYIAMEYVHGRDLRSIQKRAEERGVRIPLDLAALIVSKICSALEYAHRKKDERGRPLSIVHRDVSPQNILISFEGDVRLTDFGIAKAASKATITDRGALRGKLLYMSPEQAWGQPVDRRADIFALGVVFYELATGHKPFLASSEGSILDAVRECRIAPPTTINPRIPEKLARVVMKALDRDPEQRYQDAAEMYRDLDRVLHERQVPSAPELARLMQVLFDEQERGELAPAEGALSTGAELHVEFDGAGESKPGSRPEKGAPSTGAELHVEFDGLGESKPGSPGNDPSIEKLLRRIGI